MIVIQPFFNQLVFGPEPTLSNQRFITSTSVLTLPVNCVVIGNQPEEKKSKFVTDFTGVLKNIFRE